ncbi:hypothetical protein [uncultured Faecalibaculum sp.]|uniref:hypothetical protein n=1 Tax=uncultured Faecalibaculum sp. TaxID=1729681 RepID=UPI00272E759C|nr:hypothetical protein [uncultured Faecalibaculum sp.]
MNDQKPGCRLQEKRASRFFAKGQLYGPGTGDIRLPDDKNPAGQSGLAGFRDGTGPDPDDPHDTMWTKGGMLHE